MDRTYNYQPDKLNISIPTVDPAALHSMLLQGLKAAMDNYIAAGENRNSNGQLELLQLLQALLPDELELSKNRS